MKFAPVALVVLLASLRLSAAGADLTFAGSISLSDPVFNRPSSATSLSGLGSAVHYQTFSFTADTSGNYGVLGDYRAAAGSFDGFLLLYTSFNPGAPLLNLVAGSDDFSIGGAPAAQGSFLASAEAFGPGVVNNALSLVPGTSYTIVLTGFANDDLGPFSMTVSGAIPEPSGVALAVAGIGGLGCALASRRRRI